jgi:hypothetical protein
MVFFKHSYLDLKKSHFDSRNRIPDVCAKMENLYSENATCTWLLDAHQHYMPSNYIFFAQYLAYNGPLILGVFLVNNQPIPPSWTMYPAEISCPFHDVHHSLIQSYRSISKAVPRGGGPDAILSAGEIPSSFKIKMTSLSLYSTTKARTQDLQ